MQSQHFSPTSRQLQDALRISCRGAPISIIGQTSSREREPTKGRSGANSWLRGVCESCCSRLKKNYFFHFLGTGIDEVNDVEDL